MKAPVRFAQVRTAGGHQFGHASLDTPERLNVLSMEMVQALLDRFRAWEADPEIAGVILDGHGEKGFCGGTHAVRLARDAAPEPFFAALYRLAHRIQGLRKPVLCWAHGYTFGSGVGLLAAASHRVVTPQSRIALPEVAIGWFPDVGATAFLPQMPGHTGLFLALTGAPMNAGDALYTGLADVMLLDEERRAVLFDIAATHWTGEQHSDGARLTALLLGRSGRATAPGSLLQRHRARIDGIAGASTLAEAAMRFGSLVGNADPWLDRAGVAFGAASPTALALAHTLQRRGGGLSLAEALRLEYRAARVAAAHPDFAEGVRARLLEKGGRPHWRPATLAQVPVRQVEAQLAALEPGAHPLADLD